MKERHAGPRGAVARELPVGNHLGKWCLRGTPHLMGGSDDVVNVGVMKTAVRVRPENAPKLVLRGWNRAYLDRYRRTVPIDEWEKWDDADGTRINSIAQARTPLKSERLLETCKDLRTLAIPRMYD